ncbi:MAG: DUF58 domain-containing protein [Verrucomicrobia bacterium]|nr:DUF58 domain-containing protein [Verrucomicrobiota bacterium]OQW97627.1 MAG: hypothetical protein BWK77_01260 [Verrucomicrobia bacterium A1]
MIPREILRKVRRIEIRSRRLVNEVFAGQYQSVFKGRGMEFDEVREYQPGDDVRSIDWNVTARMGQPFVKKFVEERELTVLFLADVSASNRFGSIGQLKKDLVAEMTAVLAFSAIRNNDRVGLVLFSEDIECYVPPRKGVGHGLRVIREALYHEPRHRGTAVVPALEFLNHVITRRSVCFLLSDFRFPDAADRLLSVAARRHDLIAVVVSDRREQAWPKDGGLVEFEDLETGERFLRDASHAGTRATLTGNAATERAALLSRLRRAGIDTIEVSTDPNEPYDRALIRFFRERERRLRT